MQISQSYRGNRRGYGQKAIQLESPLPPGFICTGWKEYVKIFKVECEQFCAFDLPKYPVKKDVKINTPKPQVVQTSNKEYYNSQGQLEKLDLKSYNDKRTRQQRKFITEEESKQLSTKADISTTLKPIICQSTSSATFETVSPSSAPKVGDIDLEKSSLPEQTNSATFEDNGSSSRFEEIKADGQNGTERVIFNTISLSIVNGANHHLLAITDDHSKVTIITNTKAVKLLVEKLEHYLIPFYKQTAEKNSYAPCEETLSEFSSPFHKPNFPKSDNRQLSFGIVLKCNQLLFRITETFTLYKLSKEIRHEIYAPASYMPEFLQSLVAIVIQWDEKITGKGPTTGGLVHRDNGAALETSDDCQFSLVEQSGKQFLQIIAASVMIRVHIAAVFECVFNLTNVLIPLYQNLDVNGSDTRTEFSATRLIVCDGTTYAISLKTCGSNCYLSIQQQEPKNAGKNSQEVLLNASSIGSFLKHLQNVLSQTSACIKCGDVNYSKHRCSVAKLASNNGFALSGYQDGKSAPEGLLRNRGNYLPHPNARCYNCNRVGHYKSNCNSSGTSA